MPWDVVFVDDILREMATIRPVNENEFLQLEGVDKLKLDKYGGEQPPISAPQPVAANALMG